jgi:hypothetical protein
MTWPHKKSPGAALKKRREFFHHRRANAIAYRRAWRFDDAMPDDPFVREKFTKERSAARRA